MDRDGNESKLSRKRDRHSKMNDVEELVYKEGTPQEGQQLFKSAA